MKCNKKQNYASCIDDEAFFIITGCIYNGKGKNPQNEITDLRANILSRIEEFKDQSFKASFKRVLKAILHV